MRRPGWASVKASSNWAGLKMVSRRWSAPVRQTRAKGCLFTISHVTTGLVAIGWCLKKLERPGDAAEAMRLAIETVGKHPRLLYNLACYHSLAGDDTEALQALMAAISRYPQYAQVAAKDRDFDRVRSDPRFAAIVAEANAVSG